MRVEELDGFDMTDWQTRGHTPACKGCEDCARCTHARCLHTRGECVGYDGQHRCDCEVFTDLLEGPMDPDATYDDRGL